MPSRTAYQSDREQFAERATSQLLARVRGMQGRLYVPILELITGLQVDDAGRFRFTVSNILQANKVSATVTAFNQAEQGGFLVWVFGRLRRLFGLNRSYFNSFTETTESIDEKALRSVMLRYGYDTTRGRIIPDGYLPGVVGNDQIALDIARRIQGAVASRMPRAEFLRTFSNDFKATATPGYLERYYDRFTGDLFAEFDRSVQNEYAQSLGLKHAIYSGTVMKNTRHFCRQRVNRIYTDKEIDSWNKLQWQGKMEGVDVRVALGGYRCRHHLSWISEELAQELAKKRKQEIDSYA